MSVTEDALLGGRIKFRQAADGYRAGMDAALLAAACVAKVGERVLDVGCGAGAVMLAAAARYPETTFVGLERDGAALELARDNIAANDLTERMTAIAGDVGNGWKALGLKAFDHILCNPPFFDDQRSLRGPSPAKEGAWIADAGLEAWVEFLVKAAREGGSITIIHRTDRLGDILGLFAPKVGSIQIRPVHPFAEANAKRVIVRGIKTGKTPLRLAPPIVLHEATGAFRPEVDAIFRGEALRWT